FKDAEEQISYALDLDPKNSVYWGQLMTYQAAGGDPERSLETYEKAKTHIVPDGNLKMYYASVAQMAKRYDIASGVYREMIDSIQPGLKTDSLLTLRDVRPDITMGQLDMLSRLFTSLGDVYQSGGESERAYRAYDNAITLDSSNAMALNNYAYFLSTGGGDLDKALSLSERSISGADADNPTYLDTYAWINYLLGNYEKAEEVQRRALEESKKENYRSAELYDHLGDILARNGRLEEAVEAWREAAAIQEEHKETDEESYRLTLSKIKEAEPKIKEMTVSPAPDAGGADAGQQVIERKK
ncbi:MAG: tetratricopeptide repeat protein, partial [Muribaculaceae bacterium]|nr:tetratricopeptide repeat protein [Muribaculaceae bacterium]